MRSMLFGVEVRDPLVFIGVPLLLALIALLAVWVPAGAREQGRSARRASLSLARSPLTPKTKALPPR